jgi:hypothetical protein
MQKMALGTQMSIIAIARLMHTLRAFFVLLLLSQKANQSGGGGRKGYSPTHTGGKTLQCSAPSPQSRVNTPEFIRSDKLRHGQVCFSILGESREDDMVWQTTWPFHYSPTSSNPIFGHCGKMCTLAAG